MAAVGVQVGLQPARVAASAAEVTAQGAVADQMPPLSTAPETTQQSEVPLTQAKHPDPQQEEPTPQAEPRPWSMADDRAILTKLFLGFDGQAPPQAALQMVSAELSSSGGAACSAADVHARLDFLAAEFQKHKPDAP